MRIRFYGPALALGLGIWGAASPVRAQSASGPVRLTVDDFEGGIAAWTRSDKNRAGLSDIVATRPGPAVPRSNGAALLAFKASSSGWASVSRPVDGAAWAKIGANRLTFWISGGGAAPGVSLQLRAKNAGSDLTFSLPKPVRLDVTNWRRVAIPLSDFRGPRGETLAPRLSAVYSLQFAQSGAWNSRFFSIDDLIVEGSGTPIVVASAPRPGASGGASAADAARISADFKRVAGSIRAAANVSVGASYAGPGATPLESSVPFREALALLKPRFVRLDVAALADLSDSSRPSFDFARLVSAATRAAARRRFISN